MRDSDNQMQAIASALEALMSISAKDHDDSADIDVATACLFRIQRRHLAVSAGPEAAIGEPNKAMHDDDNRQDNGPFRYADLPISEAAVRILSNESNGRAMSLKGIIEIAQDGGYRFDGAYPHNSARAAFIRRARGQGDLIQVSRTDWGLREWYTQREITQFWHTEATKNGQNAARARGTWVTKGWAISPEQADDIKKRLASGEKQSAIAREYNLTNNTIHRYKKLLADWSLGDPFPPKKKDKNEAPKLRAVE